MNRPATSANHPSELELELELGLGLEVSRSNIHPVTLFS
jgi:hypothetical protein